ncbi:MAG: hypothetical protein KME60_07150 [Cyanomargarita calcarea GSE-NOS-MK-12-04C]|jgi:hypothetical protein|uniref:Uncharacterized protein n=1 Tax=Cyanomargarita calcarea GSE-NOS-MK-12-04C TaxID=2839659 RepID=A0A951USF9_9CYAN|nr:hypothetical protein [Cyanomargarita calcarea GSE-NOS-MK-12-04C]
MAKQPESVLFTTPQVAEAIGVAEGTVRSWLSRYTCFIENHHYIKEKNGRTLWLEAGVEFLKSRATEFAAPKVAESVAPGEEIIEPLLDATAQKLAYLYFRKLPQRTVERIQQMLHNPTQEDKEVLQQAMQQSIQAGSSHLIANSTAKRLAG